MAKNTIPAKDVDPTGQYECPLCEVQKTSSIPDTGWILCPMIGGKAICLGCCFDYQSITRSPRYDSHPFLPDLELLATANNNDISKMRLACLRHQIQLCLDDIQETKDAIKKKAFVDRIKDLEMIISDLEDKMS
ncbi:MAG: hypothetical protein AB7F87_21470 [Oligoflexales bacterium]